jgi:hypothetical protein
MTTRVGNSGRIAGAGAVITVRMGVGLGLLVVVAMFVAADQPILLEETDPLILPVISSGRCRGPRTSGQLKVALEAMPSVRPFGIPEAPRPTL